MTTLLNTVQLKDQCVSIVNKDTETGNSIKTADCEIDDESLALDNNNLTKDGLKPSLIIENFRTKYKGRYTFT